MKFYSAEIILKRKQSPAPTEVKPPDHQPVPANPPIPTESNTIKKADILHYPSIKRDCWLSEIESLEAYFNSICNLQKNVRLDAATVITDPVLFLDSHFQTIKANNGNRFFLPFLDRLKKYRQNTGT